MEHLPQPLGPLGAESGVDGARPGGALLERLLQAPLVEGVDGVAHGLVVAAQGAGDPGGALAPVTGKQDLAPAEDESVGRMQALLQSLALVVRERTHEDGFSHGAQVSISPTTSSEDALGADAAGGNFLLFSDLEQSVRDRAEKICGSELIPDDAPVTGAIFRGSLANEPLRYGSCVSWNNLVQAIWWEEEPWRP